MVCFLFSRHKSVTPPHVSCFVFSLLSLLNAFVQSVPFSFFYFFFKIICEKVRDLLSESPKGEINHNLKVREDPKLGPYVEGLTARTVTDFEGIDALMESGQLPCGWLVCACVLCLVRAFDNLIVLQGMSPISAALNSG